MEELLLAEWEGSGFLVGKSSAAILFLSGPQVGWVSAQVKLRSRHIRGTGTVAKTQRPEEH